MRAKIASRRAGETTTGKGRKERRSSKILLCYNLPNPWTKPVGTVQIHNSLGRRLLTSQQTMSFL